MRKKKEKQSPAHVSIPICWNTIQCCIEHKINCEVKCLFGKNFAFFCSSNIFAAILFQILYYDFDSTWHTHSSITYVIPNGINIIIITYYHCLVVHNRQY